MYARNSILRHAYRKSVETSIKMRTTTETNDWWKIPAYGTLVVGLSILTVATFISPGPEDDYFSLSALTSSWSMYMSAYGL